MAVSANIIRYTEIFSDVSLVTVTHNLGYKPIVVVQWNDGVGGRDYRLLGAPIKHVSANQFIVDFGNYSFSGRITYV